MMAKMSQMMRPSAATSRNEGSERTSAVSTTCQHMHMHMLASGPTSTSTSTCTALHCTALVRLVRGAAHPHALQLGDRAQRTQSPQSAQRHHEVQARHARRLHRYLHHCHLRSPQWCSLTYCRSRFPSLIN